MPEEREHIRVLKLSTKAAGQNEGLLLLINFANGIPGFNDTEVRNHFREICGLPVDKKTE
ncbi:MAG: hypothetical protein A2927_03030 [Candidatus Komeilibacteria bacterium RIFCSPLOWO2_01_FULL_45_10]|uniref:Uncharacterized protein n=1 Tax=Candidatus Komeilibacteria bacterium RIFCSPLOWO2_01_FULL_45_10 TaxID=1798550 RepID=A0A1G2BHW2_9BACT|nr:MAG: hypothetical protein A2927_03030 [Candidatus Komeilibacteria bacterium RIFCSPLOWO2_01_FULL_45_10]